MKKRRTTPRLSRKPSQRSGCLALKGCFIHITALTHCTFPKRLFLPLLIAAGTALSSIPLRLIKRNLTRNRVTDLTIAVVNSRTIQHLNRRFLGRNFPTDVLSFSRLSGKPSLLSFDIGDIVVCWKVAKAQAESEGKSYIEELQTLVVHAVLHLFGYDHEVGMKKKNIMMKLQKQIFKKLRNNPSYPGSLDTFSR